MARDDLLELEQHLRRTPTLADGAGGCFRENVDSCARGRGGVHDHPLRKTMLMCYHTACGQAACGLGSAGTVAVRRVSATDTTAAPANSGYPQVPCSARSSPSTSLRASTRIPHSWFIAHSTANEAVKVNRPTDTRPRACTPSWCGSPV